MSQENEKSETINASYKTNWSYLQHRGCRTYTREHDFTYINLGMVCMFHSSALPSPPPSLQQGLFTRRLRFYKQYKERTHSSLMVQSEWIRKQAGNGSRSAFMNMGHSSLSMMPIACPPPRPYITMHHEEVRTHGKDFATNSIGSEHKYQNELRPRHPYIIKLSHPQ